jgi:hypothetical protein
VRDHARRSRMRWAPPTRGKPSRAYAGGTRGRGGVAALAGGLDRINQELYPPSYALMEVWPPSYPLGERRDRATSVGPVSGGGTAVAAGWDAGRVPSARLPQLWAHDRPFWVKTAFADALSRSSVAGAAHRSPL